MPGCLKKLKTYSKKQESSIHALKYNLIDKIRLQTRFEERNLINYPGNLLKQGLRSRLSGHAF